MILRKNNSFSNISGSQLWPYRSCIAFNFLNKSINGLPNQNEIEQLNNLEDKIFEIFQKKNESLVVIIITTSGFREYMIYTGDAESFSARLSDLKSLYPQYKITAYTKEDKQWEGYNSYK